jgi:hypothetical protein
VPRSTKRTAATVVTSLLVAGAAGVACAAHPTGAATGTGTVRAAPASKVTTVAHSSPAQVPSGFVDLATSPLTADGQAHDLTVHYRNTGATSRIVAPQILVECPDAGPYLSPDQVRLQQLDPATGRWTTVALGTQTGTLYTAIPSAGQRLPAGADLVVSYRVTVQPSSAAAADRAVVQPRIVLFDSTRGS